MRGGGATADREAGLAPAPAGPGARHSARLVRSGRKFAESVLKAYSGVYFGSTLLPGVFFLAATFVAVPRHGLLGLAGLLLTQGAARLLGVDPEGRDSGFYALNGLLVGLALGLFYRPSPALFGLLAVAAVWTVAVAAAARSLAERLLGVPVLSLPFVLTTWAALLAARRFFGLELTLEPIWAAGLGAGHLPAVVELYLRSLSAALFQLSIPAGLLVLLGLVLSSRWAALLSVLGFTAGLLTYELLGGPTTDLSVEIIGFNFQLAAIAVGGIFVVLSPGSLALAALAGVLAAGASAALLILLQPIDLPPLALPFIVTVHLLLYALGRRTRAGRLDLVRGVPGAPEENRQRARGLARRYPDPATPLIYLPVYGDWWISQGHDGEHTHQGSWRHAWDLEVRDPEGFTCRGEGTSPADYLCYGLPVFAPGDGQIVHAVGHLPDCPIGQPDLEHNWGNCLVIWHGGEVYSLLAHLQPASLVVSVGDRVVAGQLVARVGSSGRSPRPHLHLHVQGGPLPGAATLDAELLHYVEQEPTGPLYRTHGKPPASATVAALAVAELRREALAFPVGRRWRWQGQLAGRPVEEEWSMELDLLGRRSLVARPGGGRLDLHGERAYTTVLRYQGPGNTLLHLLALGLPRAPHTEQPVHWTDELAPGPALTPLGRVLYELALPFGELAALRTTSRIVPDPALLIVETRLEVAGLLARLTRPLPDTIRLVASSDGGPVRLGATRGGRPWAEATCLTEPA